MPTFVIKRYNWEHNDSSDPIDVAEGDDIAEGFYTACAYLFGSFEEKGVAEAYLATIGAKLLPDQPYFERDEFGDTTEIGEMDLYVLTVGEYKYGFEVDEIVIHQPNKIKERYL